jgi:hypothetical protein
MLSTSCPGATVTPRSPAKVSGVVVLATSAGPDARRAMVACANVTGTVPNRFDSRTRAVVPPNVGVRIARVVSSRMTDLGFNEASYRSKLSAP